MTNYTKAHKEAVAKAVAQRTAQMYLSIDTLRTQGSDRLDFHEVSGWSLEAALVSAYEAGKTAAAGSDYYTKAKHGLVGDAATAPIGK